jgi:hypothetical protein
MLLLLATLVTASAQNAAKLIVVAQFKNDGGAGEDFGRGGGGE